jgi:hypothetical protein
MKLKGTAVFLVTIFLLALVASCKVCYKIYGRSGCYYFESAKSTALSQQRHKPNDFTAEIFEFNYSDWYPKLNELKSRYGVMHSTSPFIVEGCATTGDRFVGGRDAFMAELAKSFSLDHADV